MLLLRVVHFWRNLDTAARAWAVALFGMMFQEPRLTALGPAPADLAALPLLVLGARALLERKWLGASADVGVGGWTAGALAAAFVFLARTGWSPASGAVHHALAALYLAALYAAVRATATPTSLAAFPALLRGAALLAGGLGIAGWGLALAGVRNPLAFQLSHYLYIGSLPQAQGFLPSKNMLASILGVALILDPRRPALLILALGASLSRSLIPIGAGAALAWTLVRRRRRALGLSLATVLTIAYLLLSHIAIVWSEEERRGLSRHVSGPPLACFGSAGGPPCAHWTVYRFTKAASLEAIVRTWPWGLGPGQQPAFEADLKTEGIYPALMPAYLPHGSYTGVPAEYGAAGLAGLTLFVGAVFVTVRRLLEAAGEERVLAARMTGALAVIGIEAMTTDVMHFRHLFWLVAVAGAYDAMLRQRRPYATG